MSMECYRCKQPVSPRGIDIYPASQQIVRAWGSPPKLDLPAEWSILSVVLRVIEALERKESEA